MNKSTQKLVDEFGEIIYSDKIEHYAKSCAKLCLEKQVEENKSLLGYAQLHMDDRAILVLSNRITELQQQIKEL